MSGSWSVVELASKKADEYEPPNVRYGVLFLHDTDGMTLSRRPESTSLFDALHLACVCPHGDQTWWTDRICVGFDLRVTAERHLIDQVLPFFARRWGLNPRSVGLLGFGMGGQGALRLAFKHPEQFPVVAAVAPSLDYYEEYGRGTPLDGMYDSKEQCRQDTALLHLHPTHYPAHIFYCIDPGDILWYRGADRLHEKMNALGVPHESDFSTRAGGHSWEYFMSMAGRALRFIESGLEQEARRLL
jgi:S-formylglutathione hydrolase